VRREPSTDPVRTGLSKHEDMPFDSAEDRPGGSRFQLSVFTSTRTSGVATATLP
jgi:hypothetical protein